MATEKRKTKRYDKFVTVECKPQNAKGIFLGITGNISTEGFSMESQRSDFGMGNILEFKLNDPHSDLVVNVSGEIVWSRPSWYKHILGVKFHEPDEETKDKIDKLLFAIKDVPEGALALEKADESVPDKSKSDKEEASIIAGSDLSRYDGILRAEELSDKGEKSAPEDGRTSGSVLENKVLPEEMIKKIYEDVGEFEANQKKKRWLYVSIVTIALLITIVVIPEVIKKISNGLDSPGEIISDSISEKSVVDNQRPEVPVEPLTKIPKQKESIVVSNKEIEKTGQLPDSTSEREEVVSSLPLNNESAVKEKREPKVTEAKTHRKQVESIVVSKKETENTGQLPDSASESEKVVSSLPMKSESIVKEARKSKVIEAETPGKNEEAGLAPVANEADKSELTVKNKKKPERRQVVEEDIAAEPKRSLDELEKEVSKRVAQEIRRLRAISELTILKRQKEEAARNKREDEEAAKALVEFKKQIVPTVPETKRPEKEVEKENEVEKIEAERTIIKVEEKTDTEVMAKKEQLPEVEEIVETEKVVEEVFKEVVEEAETKPVMKKEPPLSAEETPDTSLAARKNELSKPEESIKKEIVQNSKPVHKVKKMPKIALFISRKQSSPGKKITDNKRELSRKWEKIDGKIKGMSLFMDFQSMSYSSVSTVQFSLKSSIKNKEYINLLVIECSTKQLAIINDHSDISPVLSSFSTKWSDMPQEHMILHKVVCSRKRD